MIIVSDDSDAATTHSGKTPVPPNSVDYDEPKLVFHVDQDLTDKKISQITSGVSSTTGGEHNEEQRYVFFGSFSDFSNISC